VSNGEQKAGDPKAEQRKLQFDYAWKWFSFHADQRTKVFNFMLIVFGIFAAGIVNALDKHLPKIAAAGLAIFAAILALIFSRLDRRNRDLLWRGEDVLKKLEREVIFGTSETVDDSYGQKVPLSILTRGDPPTKLTKKNTLNDAILGKHRLWFPCIAYLFSGLFAAAAILIWFYWNDPTIEAGGPG
jgi:hypothetical protein